MKKKTEMQLKEIFHTSVRAKVESHVSEPHDNKNIAGEIFYIFYRLPFGIAYNAYEMCEIFDVSYFDVAFPAFYSIKCFLDVLYNA